MASKEKPLNASEELDLSFEESEKEYKPAEFVGLPEIVSQSPENQIFNNLCIRRSVSTGTMNVINVLTMSDAQHCVCICINNR